MPIKLALLLVGLLGACAAFARRHGRLAVKLTCRLMNGSGVWNVRVLSGVIRPG